MKFPFEVKKNGVYYPAGTDVPYRSKEQGDVPPVPAPGKVERPKKEPEKKAKYTEEDINLPYMKLKSLAIKEGFKVEKSAKAEDIKEMLRTL